MTSERPSPRRSSPLITTASAPCGVTATTRAGMLPALAEVFREHGYAGAFTVFGHAGCYGDEGHCLPDQRYTDAFDRRLPHPLRPLTRTVIATEAVRRAIADPGVSEVLVVVVAVMPEDELTAGHDEPLRYDSVRLLTYEG